MRQINRINSDLAFNQPGALNEARNLASDCLSSAQARRQFFAERDQEEGFSDMAGNLLTYVERHAGKKQIKIQIRALRIQLLMLYKISELRPEKEIPGLSYSQLSNGDTSPRLDLERSFIGLMVALYDGVASADFYYSLRAFIRTHPMFERQISPIWPVVKRAYAVFKTNFKAFAPSDVSDSSSIDLYKQEIASTNKQRDAIKSLVSVAYPILNDVEHDQMHTLNAKSASD
jgi:hypothetical protein